MNVEATAEQRVSGARSRSILLILAAIALASLVDLALTLWKVDDTIIYEANPVAAGIMQHGPWAVIFFKLVMLSITLSLLWMARHRTSGYVGSIMCMVILMALGVQWMRVLWVTRGLAPSTTTALYWELTV